MMMSTPVLISSLLAFGGAELIATEIPTDHIPLSFNKDFLQNQSYDKLTSPFEITGKVQSYYINPLFIILASVDESKQLVSYIAEINTWHDPRLVFDPEVMGYDNVIVRSELLWIPPVNTFNAADLKFLDTVYSSFDARVDHTGWASYTIKGKIETVCMVDVGKICYHHREAFIAANFPFDVQYCNIDIDGGISTTEFAMLYKGNFSSMIYGLPEWELDEPVVNAIVLDGPTANASIVVITFRMKRNPEFYVFFLILPTIVLTFTCMSALLFPLEMGGGERVNLGIAGMLGLTFMLSIIVAEVPRSSSLPIIGKWLILQLFHCIVAMLWEIPSACLIKFIEKRISARVSTTFLKKKRIPLIVHIVSSVLHLGINLAVTLILFKDIDYPKEHIDGSVLL